MTITVEHPRFSVEYRPRGGRWASIVTVESAAVAWRALWDLMGTRPAGDWRVTMLSRPCMEPATPAPVPLKVEPRGTRR